MKRLSENQTSMFSPAESNYNMDYNSKKMKIEPNMKPSRVVHFRGVPSDTTDSDIIQLGMPFGKMVNLVLAKKRNQALLEMEDLNAAKELVSFYMDKPPVIRERTVYVQYSNYDQLKTDNSQMLGQMDGFMDETKVVLRVVLDNMQYPITIDVLKMIFSKYGQVLKVITYNKNNSFQALIQMSDGASAKTALLGLNGQNVYNGCCTLRIDFSHMHALQVKYNNDKSWDFTNPTLPSSSDSMGMFEGGGDGILGSYAGTHQMMAPAVGMGGFGGGGGMMKAVSNGNNSLLGLGGLLGGNMMGNSGGLLGLPHLPPSSAPSQAVLIVSNLNDEKITPDYLFTLFGMYGLVSRVKIMYNKKDTALVQFQDPALAHNAISCLDKLKWYGKVIKVSQSKHSHIQMPRDGQTEEGLTKDYSTSKLHRHTNPASKNYGSVNPPSSTLHVANLPTSMTEEELKELFSTAGTVLACKILEKERRMALMEMDSVEDAVAALVENHNYHLPGPHYLKVSFTKSVI